MNNIVKVDMIPKSFGVRTLSCSQGDTKREFKFTLYDANQTIDTSDVEIALPQFPVYKGGTEEILPTNGSVPSTAPIIADIQYPQGLLTDQGFTYRQSPTEEDGNAKITDIKGNTLVWNQLVQNGNFTDTTGWSLSDSVSLSVANNVLTATIGTTHHSSIRLANTNLTMVSGKKYLFMCDIKPSKNTNVRIQYNGVATDITTQTMTANVWSRYSSFATMTADNILAFYYNAYNSLTEGDTVQFRNCVLFDLSIMGLDITDPSEFTSLFPLPYYSYNQGSLLSFNGNGIKTTGKNLLPFDLANIKALNTSGSWNDNVYSLNQLTFKVNDDGTVIVNGTSNAVTVLDLILQSANNFVGCKFNGSSQTIDQQSIAMQFFDENNVFQTALTQYNNNSLTIPNYPKCTLRIRIGNAQTLNNVVFKPMIRNANVVDDTYQPYTSSTTSLPISTYFPTGMKSAGTVYDELTPTKGITRIGAVDLGTLTWTYDASVPRFYTTDISSLIKSPVNNDTKANIVSMYTSVSFNELYGSKENMTMMISSAGTLSIINTSYSGATAFKTAMSGVYLYYELATPTETDIESASLVTENGEIQLLPQGDYLVGTVNSSVSRKSGMFDAKVKLTDGDGTVYSNKLQLYVERSPK